MSGFSLRFNFRLICPFACSRGAPPKLFFLHRNCKDFPKCPSRNTFPHSSFKNTPESSSSRGEKQPTKYTPRTAPNRIDQAKDRYQAESSSSEQVVVVVVVLFFALSLSRARSSLPFSAPHQQAHSLPCFIWMFFSAKFSRTRQPRKVGCFSFFFSQGDEFFLYYTASASNVCV